ncbi:MAG: transposase [Candidatus Hydrogenedentes bacterium]|nr:transposase [Candidatus Hydrogenedentota bacterium]
MRSRYRIVDSEGIYFLTCTVVEWLPAFINKPDRDVLLDSLAYCRRDKGLKLYAYVIMENHFHLVAEAPDLSGVMQSFKRHTAGERIRAEEANRHEWILNQFAYCRKKYNHESKHQVWQEGSHPQLITGDEMLRQKIAYIHNNPVRRGWVEAPEHWLYSSARNFVPGERPLMEVDAIPGWS